MGGGAPISADATGKIVIHTHEQFLVGGRDRLRALGDRERLVCSNAAMVLLLDALIDHLGEWLTLEKSLDKDEMEVLSRLESIFERNRPS